MKYLSPYSESKFSSGEHYVNYGPAGFSIYHNDNLVVDRIRYDKLETSTLYQFPNGALFGTVFYKDKDYEFYDIVIDKKFHRITSKEYKSTPDNNFTLDDVKVIQL